MTHEHEANWLGKAIEDFVDANRLFERKLAEYRWVSGDDVRRLHAPVVEARQRLLLVLVQEAVSDEEREALLGKSD
jgi:hypothetical protein